MAGLGFARLGSGCTVAPRTMCRDAAEVLRSGAGRFGLTVRNELGPRRAQPIRLADAERDGLERSVLSCARGMARFRVPSFAFHCLPPTSSASLFSLRLPAPLVFPLFASLPSAVSFFQEARHQRIPKGAFACSSRAALGGEHMAGLRLRSRSPKSHEHGRPRPKSLHMESPCTDCDDGMPSWISLWCSRAFPTSDFHAPPPNPGDTGECWSFGQRQIVC